MDFLVRQSSPHGGFARTWSESVTLLAFSKHLAFAGLGSSPGPYVLIRRLAQFLDFLQYWDESGNRFDLPPVIENDPTERNYVSNRVGKAMADCLAKRRNNARFTHCYEDAMKAKGHPISGERPDLYCDTLTKQFAMEAKGYARRSISENEMIAHKDQARTGPLPVDFSIASVCYDIYRSPKVKYYDPPGEAEYDFELNRKLSAEYYQRILGSLDFFEKARTKYSLPREFLSFRTDRHLFEAEIIVHRQIFDQQWDSLFWLDRLIPFFGIEGDGFFIDSDGIGIAFDCEKAIRKMRNS